MASNEVVNQCVCLLCEQITSRLTQLSEQPEFMGTLGEVLGFEIPRESYYPETICFKCVFLVNSFVEFRLRVTRSMANFKRRYYFNNDGEAKQVTETKQPQPPVTLPKMLRHSPDTEYAPHTILSHQQLVDETHDSMPVITNVQSNVAFHDESGAEDRPQSTKPAFRTSAQAAYPNEPPQSHRSSSTLSEVLVEPYIPSKEVLKEYNRKMFPCSQCNKIMRTKYTLDRHLDRHRRDFRRELSKLKQRKRYVFLCNECPESFPTQGRLNTHLKSHRITFTCPDCDAQSTNPTDANWHRAICVGKKLASTDKKTTLVHHRTRSVSRNLSSAARRERNQTPFYGQSKRIKRWMDGVMVRNYPNNYNNRDDDCAASERSYYLPLDDSDRFSCITGLSVNTSCTNASLQSCTSVISIRTNYTRPKSQMSSWSLMTERRLLAAKRKTRKIKQKLGRIDLELSFKQYNESNDRLCMRRLRRRLKERNRVNGTKESIFFCSMCKYYSLQIIKTMEHEINEHKIIPLHKCVECGVRFTQKEFLIQHTILHKSGPYLCPHCEEIVATQADLRAHFDLHKYSTHPCGHCDKSFVRKQELQRHIFESHKTKEEILNLCSATGTNGTRKESLYNFQRYQYHQQTFRCPTTMTSTTNDTSLYLKRYLIQASASASRKMNRPKSYYRHRFKLGRFDCGMITSQLNDRPQSQTISNRRQSEKDCDAEVAHFCLSDDTSHHSSGYTISVTSSNVSPMNRSDHEHCTATDANIFDSLSMFSPDSLISEDTPIDDAMVTLSDDKNNDIDNGGNGNNEILSTVSNSFTTEVASFSNCIESINKSVLSPAIPNPICDGPLPSYNCDRFSDTSMSPAKIRRPTDFNVPLRISFEA